MQGPSHLLVSWYFADAAGLDSPRERSIVAWAGLAPDVDVLAYAGAIAYYGFDKDLAFENVWRVVHHRYTHGLAFVLALGVAAWLLARPGTRARVALLAMAAAALHNFLDLVLGGPTWPIYPAWPASDFGWAASWSWTIGEWPNHLVLFACLAGIFLYAGIAGRSPVEAFGSGAERWFVSTVRGERRAAAAGARRRLRVLIWIALIALVAAVLAPLGFDPGR